MLNSAVLANFNDAVSVRLRSATVINLYDANGLQIGDAAHPIGTLTFDSAGLYSQGGNTTVNAMAAMGRACSCGPYAKRARSRSHSPAGAAWRYSLRRAVKRVMK